MRSKPKKNLERNVGDKKVSIPETLDLLIRLPYVSAVPFNKVLTKFNKSEKIETSATFTKTAPMAKIVHNCLGKLSLPMIKKNGIKTTTLLCISDPKRMIIINGIKRLS